jgi:Leucine Rich repeat
MRPWRLCLQETSLAAALSLVALAGCMSFPGSPDGEKAGVFKGLGGVDAILQNAPDEKKRQIWETCLVDKIRRAGGEVTQNFSLLPESTIVLVDVHRTKATDEDLVQLQFLTNLRILNLYGTRITDGGLQHLARLTRLQTLTLTGTNVTNAGLAHIRYLPDLRVLGLHDTHVTDEGLFVVREMKSLNELTLSGPGITDDGILQLVHLSHLKKLILANTKVTKEGLAALQKALPDLHAFRL